MMESLRIVFDFIVMVGIIVFPIATGFLLMGLLIEDRKGGRLKVLRAWALGVSPLAIAVIISLIGLFVMGIFA